MAKIKIGTDDALNIKIGNDDVSSIYVGNDKIYPDEPTN